jgi:hypothetical protein
VLNATVYILGCGSVIATGYVAAEVSISVHVELYNTSINTKISEIIFHIWHHTNYLALELN